MSATPETAIPLQQPKTTATETQALTFFVEAILSHVRTAHTVEVMNVTPGPGSPPLIGTVDVLPLVSQVNGAGQGQAHGTIYGRPYIRLQSGGSALILDPSIGDKGLLVCCDRDISNVVATLSAALPASLRRFNFADGIYVGSFGSKTAATDYVWVKSAGAGIAIVTQGTLTAQASQINATGPVDANGATIDSSGNLNAPSVKAGNGATGSFTGNGGTPTVTVQNGIITSITP